MVTFQEHDKITIAETEDFDPVKVFECGQCFRWNADECGVYRGIAFGVPAEVRLVENCVEIKSRPGSFENLWNNYFDMNTDYAHARAEICIDDYMKRASEYGKGIRILRQEPWEALCSFIISQCSNIPRIKKTVEKLCEAFGEEEELDGHIYYSFPAVGKIASLEEKDLAPIRCGYRAGYIINAARAVCSGELDLDALYNADSETALCEVEKLKGVGAKVANCFVLFGLHKMEAFPIDVWMKRTIEKHYGKEFNPAVFGQFAGLAQQYMFYHARSGEN